MVKVRINVDKLLKKYNLTQVELANKTGIRQAAISDMARNKKERISLIHVARIADVLDIKDINEIISLEDESN